MPKTTKPKTTKPETPETEQETPVPASDEAPKTQPVTVKHGDTEHTYDVFTDAADDFELLDDLARIDDGDASRIPRVLRRLIGSDQVATAMERLRDPKTGRVSNAAGTRLVFDLIKGFSGN